MTWPISTSNNDISRLMSHHLILFLPPAHVALRRWIRLRRWQWWGGLSCCRLCSGRGIIVENNCRWVIWWLLSEYHFFEGEGGEGGTAKWLKCCVGEGSLKDQFSTYYINGVPHVGEKVIDGPLTDSDWPYFCFISIQSMKSSWSNQF